MRLGVLSGVALGLGEDLIQLAGLGHLVHLRPGLFVAPPSLAFFGCAPPDHSENEKGNQTDAEDPPHHGDGADIRLHQQPRDDGYEEEDREKKLLESIHGPLIAWASGDILAGRFLLGRDPIGGPRLLRIVAHEFGAETSLEPVHP